MKELHDLIVLEATWLRMERLNKDKTEVDCCLVVFVFETEYY